MMVGPPPPPAPAFDTLPPDPDHPGSRLVPADGRVSIGGEQWTFRDIRSIAAPCGEPWVTAVSGPRPTVIAPARIGGDCTFSIGYASPSVIEEADEPPIVATGFGPARWGTA